MRAAILLTAAAAAISGCAASPRGDAAWARVTCDVTPSGRPANCSAVEEHPVGRGLGGRAVDIVQRGQLTKPTVAAARRGARFTVTVPFDQEAGTD